MGTSKRGKLSKYNLFSFFAWARSVWQLIQFRVMKTLLLSKVCWKKMENIFGENRFYENWILFITKNGKMQCSVEEGEDVLRFENLHDLAPEPFLFVCYSKNFIFPYSLSPAINHFSSSEGKQISKQTKIFIRIASKTKVSNANICYETQFSNNLCNVKANKSKIYSKFTSNWLGREKLKTCKFRMKN